MWKYSTISTKLATVLVIVFFTGTILSVSATGLCFVSETNQTLQHYCEWSNWFPWNCEICRLGVPGGFSLASRTRSICCDLKLALGVCRTACNVTNNDVSEKGICEISCPHLNYTTAKETLRSTAVEAHTRPSALKVSSISDLHKYNIQITAIQSEIQPTSTLPRQIRSSTSNFAMSTSTGMSTSKLILGLTSAKTSPKIATTSNKTLVPNKSTLSTLNTSARLAQTFSFRSTVSYVATTDLNLQPMNQTASIFVSQKTTQLKIYTTVTDSPTKSTSVTSRTSKDSQNILSFNSTHTASNGAILKTLYTPTRSSPLLFVSVPVPETASNSHDSAHILPKMTTNSGMAFTKDITYESPTFNRGSALPQRNETSENQSTVNGGLVSTQTSITAKNQSTVNGGMSSTYKSITSENQSTATVGLVSTQTSITTKNQSIVNGGLSSTQTSIMAENQSTVNGSLVSTQTSITAKNQSTVNGGMPSTYTSITAENQSTVNGGLVSTQTSVTSENQSTVNGGLVSTQTRITAMNQSTVNGGLVFTQTSVTAENQSTVNKGLVSTQTSITAENQSTVNGRLVSTQTSITAKNQSTVDVGLVLIQTSLTAENQSTVDVALVSNRSNLRAENQTTVNGGFVSTQTNIRAENQSTVDVGLVSTQSNIRAENQSTVNGGFVSTQTNITTDSQSTQQRSFVDKSAGPVNSISLLKVVHTDDDMLPSDDQCCYLGSWRLYSSGRLRLCLFILVSCYTTIATTGLLVIMRVVRSYTNRKSRVHTTAKPAFNDSVW